MVLATVPMLFCTILVNYDEQAVRKIEFMKKYIVSEKINGLDYFVN